MEIHQVYHSLVDDLKAVAGDKALVVAIHGVSRNRLEVGALLSSSNLNAGANLQPPSLESWTNTSSLRALGPVDKLLWGERSSGALLAAARPGLEVVPSPTTHCPSTSVCPSSSSSSYFR